MAAPGPAAAMEVANTPPEGRSEPQVPPGEAAESPRVRAGDTALASRLGLGARAGVRRFGARLCAICSPCRCLLLPKPPPPLTPARPGPPEAVPPRRKVRDSIENRQKSSERQRSTSISASFPRRAPCPGGRPSRAQGEREPRYLTNFVEQPVLLLRLPQAAQAAPHVERRVLGGRLLRRQPPGGRESSPPCPASGSCRAPSPPPSSLPRSLAACAQTRSLLPPPTLTLAAALCSGAHVYIYGCSCILISSH